MQPTLQMMLEFCLDTDSDIGFPLQSFKSVPIVVSTRSIWFNGACGMYLKPYSVLDQLSLINWRPWTIKINSLFTHGTRLRYWQELTTIEDTRLSTLRKDCLTHSTAPQIDPERWCKSYLIFSQISSNWCRKYWRLQDSRTKLSAPRVSYARMESNQAIHLWHFE